MERLCWQYLLLMVLFRYSDLCSRSRRLISGNIYRVQDEFITANRETPNHRAIDGRVNGNTWCAINSRKLAQPWFQVSFNTAVNITFLRIGGINTSDSVDYFVTRFQVLVNGRDGNIFTPVESSANSTIFNRPKVTGVRTVNLPYPQLTRVLRIVALEWSPSNFTCMRVEAYGCLAQPACSINKPLSMDSTLLKSISASSPIPSNGIGRLVDNTSTEWCEMRVGSTPFIKLTFKRPVFWSYMKVRGLIGRSSSSYVNLYRLEYRKDSEVLRYGIIFAPTSADTTTVTLWKPVSGKVFRIHILNYMRTSTNYLCWKIRIFGCIAEEDPNESGANTTTDTLEEASALDINSSATTTAFSETSQIRNTTSLSNTTNTVSSSALINSDLVIPLASAITGFTVALAIMIFIIILIIIKLKALSNVKVDSTTDDTIEEHVVQEDTECFSNTNNEAYGNGLSSQRIQNGVQLADSTVPQAVYEEAYAAIEETYDDIV